MDKFFGREYELKRLLDTFRQPGSKLVVVKGRRRIGKSTIIEQFAANKTFYELVGLAPTSETDAQNQRDEFARQLSEQTSLPRISTDEWGDLFSLLARETQRGNTIILLDEISWMADKDPTFLGKLKTIWDTQFSKNTKLMMILCSSVSTWVDENLLGDTAFLGRPSLELLLEELPLSVCMQFWGKYQDRISSYEKLKLLSITGGVPRYLELIDPIKSAEENIREMCFTKNAILVNEFDRIFSDIFGRRSEIYRNIVQQLVYQHCTMDEIFAGLKKSKTGDLSKYLNHLIEAGFVKRDYTWHIKTGVLSKLSKFRLSDNYVRFYLRYIEPAKAKIEKNLYKTRSISTLPGWSTIMGLQFENLILNNEFALFKVLGIPLEDIVFANPYFQPKTSQQQGCQIDYLIQTQHNTVYICEIKFSRHAIKSSVISEVSEKITRLKLPKHYSYRTVLIHVNGVTEECEDSQYFSNIISFDELTS